MMIFRVVALVLILIPGGVLMCMKYSRALKRAEIRNDWKMRFILFAVAILAFKELPYIFWALVCFADLVMGEYSTFPPLPAAPLF